MSSSSASLTELGWDSEPDGGKRLRRASAQRKVVVLIHNMNLERMKRLNMPAYLFKWWLLIHHEKLPDPLRWKAVVAPL